MMVEVTSEDWDAAQIYADLYSGSECYKPSYHLRIGEAFARHRIEAEQRCKLEGARLALEAAAREADEHARMAWGIGEREGQSPICSSGRNYGARAVEQAIRALDPAKIVREGDSNGTWLDETPKASLMALDPDTLRAVIRELSLTYIANYDCETSGFLDGLDFAIERTESLLTEAEESVTRKD